MIPSLGLSKHSSATAPVISPRFGSSSSSSSSNGPSSFPVPISSTVIPSHLSSPRQAVSHSNGQSSPPYTSPRLVATVPPVPYPLPNGFSQPLDSLNRRASVPEGPPTGPFIPHGSSAPSATSSPLTNPKDDGRFNSPHIYTMPVTIYPLGSPFSSPSSSSIGRPAPIPPPKMKRRVSFSPTLAEYHSAVTFDDFPAEETGGNSKDMTQEEKPFSILDHYEYYHRSEQGQRPTQEDAIATKDFEQYLLLGVFDGHQGSTAATYCQQNALEIIASQLPLKPCWKDYLSSLHNGICETDRQFLSLAESKRLDDGSTALIACLNKNCIYVAHCGDSRAIVVNDKAPFATVLTQDHRPTLPTEASRIKKVGGKIVTKEGDCARIKPGNFPFTRSIGDRSGKHPDFPLIICEPDVNNFKLRPHMKFLILATDGVWDVLTPESCAEAVWQCKTAREVCDKVIDLSLKLGTLDNVSVIAVRLTDPEEEDQEEEEK